MKHVIESLIFGVCCLGLGACDDPAHQQQLHRREENLQKTARIFEQNEANRTDNLGRTLTMLRRQHEDDVRNSSENPGKIKKWIEDDVTRWNERQPVYRKEIETQLKGNPENIKRTIPDIIY